MKLTNLALAAAAFLALGAPLFAAEEGAKAVVATEAEKEAKRRDTIRYGIDAEIMELLKALGQEKEGRFNGDLLSLFDSSKSPKLKTGVLELFRGLEWPGAEDSALLAVENRDLEDRSVVSASLAYLAAIKSKKALAFAPKLIEEDDKALLPSLVRLLGRSGGEAEEELLLKWLEGDAPTEALRQEAIRALGEIGSTKAAEALMKIAEDPEQGKINRMYAAEALGKIGDERAVRSVVKAANADDPNVRTSAVEALSAFATAEADRGILEAFRDSFVKVRMAACKGAAKRGLAEAIPILEYKAAKDPEKAVKTEAFKALAELGAAPGNDRCFDFMKKYFEDPKSELVNRALVFGLLARKDPSSMGWLAGKLADAAKEKERSFYTALAREVSAAADAKEAAPLARVLLADKDYLFRLGGLEWARKAKSAELRGDLAALAEKDPSEVIRKKAAEILASY